MTERIDEKRAAELLLAADEPILGVPMDGYWHTNIRTATRLAAISRCAARCRRWARPCAWNAPTASRKNMTI